MSCVIPSFKTEVIEIKITGFYCSIVSFPFKVDKILKAIPKERHTYLFSATMTKKVAKLQRASLQNPVKVEVSTKLVPFIIFAKIDDYHPLR